MLKRTWVLWELFLVSLSERKDRLIPLPVSWAWTEDLNHAYVTMDIARSPRVLSSPRSFH